MKFPRKKYVLVIPDGAGDLHRLEGLSPIARARTDYADFIAREGVSGLMKTLYEDLPKESLVAQLGMLGWDPHKYYPHGRASCELLALEDIYLNANDLAFRTNFVRIEDERLKSYNADYIHSEQAAPLINMLNFELRAEFPDFELYHNSDFRNTLVIRNAGVEPTLLRCPEPHESHGMRFDVRNLISGRDETSHALAGRINRYLTRAGSLIQSGTANMLAPWSASKVFQLPSFAAHTGFDGPVAVVGSMDFLMGISKAGQMSFFKVGNGRPDTDYRAKGRTVVELLREGYEFVVCHINAPDEASHGGNLALKIETLQHIDRFVLAPIVEYFMDHRQELGGVMIVPDHYTNVSAYHSQTRRAEIHSSDPVPFALWNDCEQDEVVRFSEDDARNGKYAYPVFSHLDLLRILGVQTNFQQQHITTDNTDQIRILSV